MHDRIRNKRIDPIKLLIPVMIFFSTAIVFEFKKLSFFLILECIFCLYCLAKYKKVYIYKDEQLLILVSIVVSGLIPLISNNPISYKKCTVNYMIIWFPLYFTMTYIKRWVNGDSRKFYYIVNIVKKVFLIQLLWFPLQFVMYRFGGIDINDLIFNKTLGFRENVSFIRSGIYYPSGLTWHSAVIAPMFVLSLALFDEIWVVLLILFDVAICGNTTSLIGVTVYLIVILIDRNRRKLKMRKVIKWGLLIVAVIVPIGFMLGLHNAIFSLYQNLAFRIKYLGDRSTLAHLRYFTSIPEVYSNSSILEILFGYGNACSGLPHSLLYNQYVNAKSWVVECDIVNKLLSNGIFGFVIFYYFLIKILWKGKEINHKYFAVMLAIIIEGFFYNVQFNYVVLLEAILLYSTRWKLDFFTIKSASFRESSASIKLYNKSGKHFREKKPLITLRIL